MATTQTDFVTITTQHHILTIRFNRPDKKNAITRDMYAAMADAVLDSNTNPDIRVILFEGTEGCFTSGNDLADFMTEPDVTPDSPSGRFLRGMATAEKPIVAAVTGIAIGIGTTLLLHCDLAYAAESAKFKMPFVNLGLVPEFGSSLILPQLMGQRNAAELLLLGEAFDASKAKELGIINDIHPNADVIEAARTKAIALTQQPPSALRATKQLMKEDSLNAIKARIELEGDHFATKLTAPEALEAFQAFMEKRKPDFSSFD